MPYDKKASDQPAFSPFAARLEGWVAPSGHLEGNPERGGTVLWEKRRRESQFELMAGAIKTQPVSMAAFLWMITTHLKV